MDRNKVLGVILFVVILILWAFLAVSKTSTIIAKIYDPCEKYGLVSASTVVDMQVKPHQEHVRYVKFICRDK